MSVKTGLIVCMVMAASLKAFPQSDTFSLRDGDLLFQQSECGDFCEAINTVTEAVNGIDFNHVGIAFRNEEDQWMVLEAVSAGVVETPLDQFLDKKRDAQGRPKVAVGRLKNPYKDAIPPALREKESFVGAKYDATFDINNDRYYCSELVYFLYRDSSGQPLFPLAPMTFKDPESGETFHIWTEYYEKLGEPIPEGEPGLNPGGISMSDKLEVFFPFSRFQ